MALWWPKDSEFPKGRMDEFRPDEDGRLFQQGDDGAVFVVLEDIVHMMLWRDDFSGLITDICEQVRITFFPGQRASDKFTGDNRFQAQRRTSCVARVCNDR